jgi:F-type H+-transporting ATPase subunit epsilon
MASSTLKLKIVTPERLILEEDVTLVTLPTTEGEITILPGHVPLISSLGIGEILAKGNTATGEDDVPMTVSGGFVEIKHVPAVKAGQIETEVIILADTAEHVSEIDIERAKNRAAELMQKKNSSEIDFEHFEAELERSLNRVKIADKWRSKKYRRTILRS